VQIRFDSNAPEVKAFFDKDAAAAQVGLRQGMARAALELARQMGREQPKATSQMRNATGVEKIDPDTWHVGTSVRWGVYTDQGSGPGGWVPDAAMDEWLNLANITPHDPAMTDADLRYVIQRKIYRDGTPAQPWRAPALTKMTPRIAQLASASVRSAVMQA
jgi:hypothetical protein